MIEEHEFDPYFRPSMVGEPWRYLRRRMRVELVLKGALSQPAIKRRLVRAGPPWAKARRAGKLSMWRTRKLARGANGHLNVNYPKLARA